MARNSNIKTAAPFGRLLAGWPEAKRTLNVAFLYEDASARRKANRFCERVERLFSPRQLRGTWWKMSDLYHPGVLAGAVSQTMRADLIVVATRGTEGLPLPFYVWVNSWLPHYPAGTGALVGLLGASSTGPAPLGRVRDYLVAVAKQARLELLLEEREADEESAEDGR